MSATTLPLNLQAYTARSRRGLLVCALPLLVCDAAGLLLSGLIAVSVRHALGGRFALDFYLGLSWLVLVFLASFAFLGLYPGIGVHPVVEIRRLTYGTTLSFLLLGTSSFFMRDIEAYSRAVILASWALALVILPCSRLWLREKLGTGSPWWGEPVVILGTPESSSLIRECLVKHSFLGLRPFVCLTSDSVETGGNLISAPAYVKAFGIRYAIIALPGWSPEAIRQAVSQYASEFPQVLIVPNLFGVSSLDASALDLGGLIAVEIRQKLLSLPALVAKRAFDLFLTLLISLLLAPFLILIAFLIAVGSPGPVLFGQVRRGLNGRPFTAWKFRSMMTDAQEVLDRCLRENPELSSEWAQKRKLRRDPRITWIGKLLRHTSLDELPQLWNVLRGEMSLIGPRPIVDEEIERYAGSYKLYQKVRPGMSGLWQVSGRSSTTYGERIQFDEYYVRNWSIWLDLYILWRTIGVVLKREGAY